jgi:hypothetical protein
MRRAPWLAAVLAASLVSQAALAGDHKPVNFKFPMPEREWRAYVERVLGGLRAALSKGSPPDSERAKIENQIRHVNDRTREVCADGVVTQKEAEYVLAAFD